MEHRGRYGRDDPSIKGRGEWEQEYSEHDWDRNRRQMEWDNRENWDNMDHKQIDEEWRHYNRSLDNWQNEDRRRWGGGGGGGDWRERERSRPRSATSHHMDSMNGDVYIVVMMPESNILYFTDDTNLDARRKEPLRESAPIRIEQPPAPATESVPPPTVLAPSCAESESSRDGSIAQKRQAEEAVESPVEAKKIKPEVAPVLEDDLSEISDDADEILNRDEVSIQKISIINVCIIR